MSASSGTELLERLGQAPALKRKLKLVQKPTRTGEVSFDLAHEGAWGTLVALIASHAGRKRVWVACETQRIQETVFAEVAQWIPNAAFLPHTEPPPVEGAVGDPDQGAQRLGILAQLREPGAIPVLVTQRASLGERVPSPFTISAVERRLRRGEVLERDALIAELEKAGYEPVANVTERNQYAVRGGIVDIFCPHHTLPLRVEFFDREVESLRHFDPDGQLSVENITETTLLLGEDLTLETKSECALEEYVQRGDITVNLAAGWLGAYVQVSEAADGAAEGMLENHDTAFYSHGLDTFAAGDFVVDQFKRERFFDQLREWRVAGWATYIFCNNEGEIERFHDLLPPVEAEAIRFRVGIIAHGFTSPAAKVAVISDAEIFGRYKNQRVHRRRVQLAHDPGARAQIDFSELIDGELVVHLEHGIAMYDGMRSISRGDGTREEVLVLEFAEQAKLYVPMEQAFLVSRYVGIGKKNPPLSALGDERWGKAKRNAEKAVYDYAARLLETHAQRETMRGFAFPEDTKWMREFEASFLYTETKDQLTAIQETKADMESERPMDRLICGDVGFGKTEVAIRAAFKAVTGGKQVAFLVPTTVLAEQHYRNLRERMSDYPFNIGLLSRFGTTADRRKVVEGLRAGTVDIVVGTHRLIGKEVSFKDLGLLIVDEEQRFGVLQKERLKAQFPLVDCLTLSATPIPRTLYMSLMGARDMSTIETPPTNRIPVETFVCPYDERIIRDAVQRERAREGQVYFLHNRIASIQGIAKKIENLCPGCRVVVGHGQMDEDELELVMKQFVAGEADVLVSTTIIESGLDIPNANTIIIDRADRFGLADLYQLRGRVGRSNQKAYAYLMLPPGLITVGEARRRINAIKQYGSLGAGFKIAMRDLEIRGAGNILGTAQSGHIITIGFELYCALLKQAVAKLRGDRPAKRADAVVRLDFVVLRESEWTGKGAASALAPAFLPAEYIGEAKERIQAYRRLHEAGRPEELEQLRGQWRDRYGRMPAPVENLLLTAEIRIAAAKRKVMIVEVREDRLMLTRGGDFLLIGGKFPRLQAESAVEKLREVLNFVGGL